MIFTADNGPEALEAGGTSLTVETAVHGSAGPWRSHFVHRVRRGRFAYRSPFVGRARSAAGTESSDEIVHAMDLFPTLARIAGGKVPNRIVAIDGIDMTEFLFLEKHEGSGRDGFVVYMGNDVFGVKWRDWKIHFREQDGWNTIMRTYTMPRVFNLINDPLEQDNVLFPHTWVLKAGLPQLKEHVASLKKFMPIPTGTPDPYEPPK